MNNDLLDDDVLGTDDSLRSVEYAGFGVRLVAAIIDSLIFTPLIGLMFYNYITLKSLPIALIILLLMAAYKPLMEYYYGATLGKMAMKLKVVDRDFEEISMDQAIIRYIPWLIGSAVNAAAMVLLFQSEAFIEAEGFMDFSMAQAESPMNSLTQYIGVLPIISSLIILFNDKQESGHDKMAKTYCIRNR